MKKNNLLPFTLSLFLLICNPALAFINKTDIKTENPCITEMKKGERIWGGGIMLGMDHCQLKDDDTLAIADYLKNNPNIDSIFLIMNQLTSKGIKVLSDIQTIHELILDNNFIDNEGTKILREAKNIQSLSLGYNNITDTGIIDLTKNESINALMLDGLDITQIGADALANDKFLTLLELNNDTFLGDLGANVLAKSTTLQILFLDNDHITDSGARAFRNSTIDSLDLSGNSFTDKAAADLATVKSTTLVLKNMPFTDQAIAYIAANQTIQYLLIDADHLSDQSAFYLSHIPNHINAIWMSSNNLTSQGAIDFSHDPVLKQLDVSYNHIGPSGIAALLAVPKLHVNTEGNDGTNVSHKNEMHASYQFALQQRFNNNKTYQILKNIHSIKP